MRLQEAEEESIQESGYDEYSKNNSHNAEQAIKDNKLDRKKKKRKN